MALRDRGVSTGMSLSARSRRGLAMGAVALGALAIGRLWIGTARIRKLRIDQLEIGHIVRLDEKAEEAE